MILDVIVEDKKNNLWIGTSDGGLNFYDNTAKTYKNYLFNPDISEGVPFKDVKTVYVDEASDNRLRKAPTRSPSARPTSWSPARSTTSAWNP